MHTMPLKPLCGASEAASTPGRPDASSVIIATLAALDPAGGIEVTLPGNLATARALSAVPLSSRDIGRPVLLAVGASAGDLPVITGLPGAEAGRPALRTRLDGERLVLEASGEIELRCGGASIVLTRAGKVLIRGNFVLTHARGVNRIRGACVQIN